MGRTVRFDQIYVSSLDADPVEQDVLTTVRSIITQEIEVDLVTVDRIAISNVSATKNFSLGDSLFMDAGATSIVLDVNKTIRSENILVNDKLGISAPNPTNEFQIGENNDFIIDRRNTHLAIAKGNVFATNLFASTIIGVSDKFIVDNASSNVLKVVGNTYSTNLQAGNYLSVGNENSTLGANIASFTNGNVVISNGTLVIDGNVAIDGSLYVTQETTFDTVINLLVEDAFIQIGNTNYNGTYDNALLMTEETDGSKANLVFGYTFSNQEFVLARTLDGPVNTNITIKEDESINLHIWGQLYTEGNVGIANTSTDYTLSVGSNVFFDDTGSNVIIVNGNVYTNRLEVGPGGVKLGGRITIDEDEQIHPLTVTSNILADGIRTTGVSTSGISNTAPKDTLSIGSKIFANITAANTLTILGNTATTNLITESISTSSNITIHADRYGGDTTSNVLSLKSGPTASNVSIIEVFGASTSDTHQNIRFKTKNTERLRIASNGKIGIANTNPSEALTISGNVHVLGSNALVLGTNKSMRVYSSPGDSETRIENVVGSGKGLKIYASQTSTMGDPKMVILENSNVGIGTTQPQGIFQTSGGTVFINSQIQNKGSLNQLGVPLVVTNTNAIVGVDDDETVLLLSREGTGLRDGARASFKLGKYDDTTPGVSKTRCDIYLADTAYETENDVMTLRSDGRVGIGSTIPEAFLEVISSGIGNARQNSLMVHNHGTTSGDAIMAAQTDTQNGNAFTSYIQSNEDLNPRGWSVGTTLNNEFRITNNINAVYDPVQLGLYINGDTRNVGIGTDVPRGKLEVNGELVIGNKLSFGGLSGDLFGNTIILERNYVSGFNISELVLFKGGNGRSSGGETGPDRIRQIAGEIAFQVYTDAQIGDTGLNGLLVDEPVDFPLLINSTNNGVVVIGGNSSDVTDIGESTRLVVNGDIEFKGNGSFRLTGLSFATTEQVTVGGIITDPSVNRIRNLLTGGDLRRALTFVNQTSASIGDDEEYARFDTSGNLGIGTTEPLTGIHVYKSGTTSQDLLRLESPGTNKETGLLIYTGDGEGGYLRGFSNSENNTTGLILGVANNSTFNDCIHVTQSSNVGIGTNNPATKFHVYDGIPRIEGSVSNATIEFTTNDITSNIHSDENGNVYVVPGSDVPTTFITGDVEVSGDFSFGGNIDLGDTVGIGLGNETANTLLHVNGGFISNSDHVACKRYSTKFDITIGSGQDVQLIFDTHVFYAKIVAMLKDNDDISKTSTMILEIQGGTHDGSTATLPEIAIGTKNVFGGINDYPWSPTITVGTGGIDIRPLIKDTDTDYSYDIFVEVVTSAHGGLRRISNNISNIDTDLDFSGGGTAGGQITKAIFTY